jgi:hypothetical protein
MQKRQYPIVATLSSESSAALLGDDFQFALDGIASRVKPVIREIFLSDNNNGYVWCFSHSMAFNDSLLSKVVGKEWKPLSAIAERSDAQEIAWKLRETYNTVPLRLAELTIDNKFYNPCAVGDVVFEREPQRTIRAYLATMNGELVAKAFDSVLSDYRIKL